MCLKVGETEDNMVVGMCQEPGCGCRRDRGLYGGGNM